jgi:hypothetical protein
VAPGVKVNGTGNFTFSGQLVTFDASWYTGSGTQTLAYVQTYLGGLGTRTIGLNTAPNTGVQLHVSGDSSLPAIVRVEERTAGTTAAIQWYSNGTNRGALGLPGTQHITLNLANSANFIVSGGNMGLGMTPTVQLELSTSGAQKSSGTTWSNPSMGALKKDIAPFTEGLEMLQHVQPVRYKLNGKGGLVADEQEHIGVIADELQDKVPHMVGSYRGKLDPEDAEEMDILTFKGGDAILFGLVNAVKELAALVPLVQALSAKVDSLEARIKHKAVPKKSPAQASSTDKR